MMGIKSPPESNRRSKHRAGIRRFGVGGVTQTDFAQALCEGPTPSALRPGPTPAISGFLAVLTPRGINLFPALQALTALLYAGACEDCFALFPGSSVVEQPAVNRLVAGSNPARGANKHLNP